MSDTGNKKRKYSLIKFTEQNPEKKQKIDELLTILTNLEKYINDNKPFTEDQKFFFHNEFINFSKIIESNDNLENLEDILLSNLVNFVDKIKEKFKEQYVGTDSSLSTFIENIDNYLNEYTEKLNIFNSGFYTPIAPILEKNKLDIEQKSPLKIASQTLSQNIKSSQAKGQ